MLGRTGHSFFGLCRCNSPSALCLDDASALVGLVGGNAGAWAIVGGLPQHCPTPHGQSEGWNQAKDAR
eukprot:3784055-Amphidinium_carterae.1